MGKIATSNPILTAARKPSAAVTRARFVDAAGNQITTRGVRAYGISTETLPTADITAGKSTTLGLQGQFELEVDGAISAGVRITTTATGLGSIAVAGEVVNAITEEASAAANDRIRVTFIQSEQRVASAAITALTHAFGTADGTVVDVGGAFNQATLNDNFKECTTKIEAIRAALVAQGIIL